MGGFSDRFDKLNSKASQLNGASLGDQIGMPIERESSLCQSPTVSTLSLAILSLTILSLVKQVASTGRMQSRDTPSFGWNSILLVMDRRPDYSGGTKRRFRSIPFYDR